MTVYINWNTREVLSDSQYDERIEKYVEEHDGEAFLHDWLDDDFTPSELYEMLMTGGQEAVHDLFVEALEEDALNNLENDGFQPYEVDEEG